ncbi:AfsR/SARP family transcriptional regulator [Micromonospora sp. 4G57]|uniref:AfsR/SARP family transcriptional regulator n=1 Tax=Micromonospora sicca TaxID=2202420 RepID=A0ABU5JHM4_9ACTN|nr:MULTISPECIES: AfsR/SARP family transcriptional regulator [unclassified Micromonospora]MDZ5443989.1 AfsR/SARP family transcriptional regulator [Micromonospora sp. 4G57]MDZ5491884.1 AfsR/SARP family transcriptional regulator [Micromonospora sp. 4G53]
MKLRIRLLGTVELRVDGQVATPGAAKRRAVLAGLAIEANRSVSLHRLAEMVWSDVPPASAVANLRSHVAVLRRTLGDRLVARPNAYELRLAPDELDVAEFQRLAGEGRALLATAEPAGAIATLTAALEQWRGASGDGLPRGTALDNRWASLDEQRLQVFEELAEARLAAGQHGDLLPELRGHLAAHPLRERAWGQLMLALYRCGDVPAALTVYRDARAVLDEQLGIEPGEDLATLHRAMLDRAPELSFAPVVAAPTPPPTVEVRPAVGWTVPRELPADLVTFVGRTRETADVVDTVAGAKAGAVVVTGAAGSGKTALAVRAAHAVASGFPDGQVFVDLGYRNSVTPGEVLARVLRALGVAPADVPGNTDERAGWFRSLAAGRRFLLVVDGVTRAAQVRPLLPAGPGPALIVVGQRRLGSLDGVRRVALRPLGAAQGRDVLAAFAGPERLAADPAATAKLVRLCAGSALALRIAGTRLARCPALSVAALVAQVGDGQDRLDLLAYEDLSVRESLATGVAAVRSDDEVAGRLLELLGASPDAPARVDRAAAQLGVSAHRVRRALEELADAHLIQCEGPGGYRLPTLVREYAAELAAVPSAPTHPLPGWRVDPVAA